MQPEEAGLSYKCAVLLAFTIDLTGCLRHDRRGAWMHELSKTLKPGIDTSTRSRLLTLFAMADHLCSTRAAVRPRPVVDTSLARDRAMARAGRACIGPLSDRIGALWSFAVDEYNLDLHALSPGPIA